MRYATLDEYPEVMTAAEVAGYLQVTPGHLANLRSAGTGPLYVKLSDGSRGAVRYHREVVRQWLAERSQASAVGSRR